ITHEQPPRPTPYSPLPTPHSPPPVAERSRSPHSPLTPREAFFSPKQAIPVDQALGQICAETICPYPPGIPALLPGEPISEPAIAHLQTILTAGGTLTGCDDPTLQTILIAKPRL
ncbi:MAG: arginine decarboxylase, partial [Cyanobacteria bacterium J06560_5]